VDSTDYLRAISLEMESGYTEDCVIHACALAQLLIDEGRRPWIGRVRETRQLGERVFHAPLIPMRFTDQAARVWNTHYVCCVDDQAYDPILGAPVAIDRYTDAVFGRALPVEEHHSVDATARLLARGELRASFRRTG
jgi:hypothetical protein